MSADVTCDLFIKGKKDRLSAVLGEIWNMEHNGVSGLRFGRDHSDGVDCDDYILELSSDPWGWCYNRFINIVELVIDRYPEAIINGFFTNGSYDGCGGYANFIPKCQVYSWCVTPDDWEAYLAGDYAATWQAKVGSKIDKNQSQEIETQSVEE